MILITLIKKLYLLIGIGDTVADLEALEAEADNILASPKLWLKYVNPIIAELSEETKKDAEALREEILKAR